MRAQHKSHRSRRIYALPASAWGLANLRVLPLGFEVAPVNCAALDVVSARKR